jgi:hypothetical protein
MPLPPSPLVVVLLCVCTVGLTAAAVSPLGAATSSQCTGTLGLLCPRSTVALCNKCVGSHQAALRHAGCSAAQVRSWCTAVAGGVDAATISAGGGASLGRHSEQLMGITAYGQPDFDKHDSQQLVRALGIRSIGIQAMVTQFAPAGMSIAELKAWFETDDSAGSSSPALRYANRTAGCKSVIRLIASHGMRAAGAEPWVYLKTGDGTPCKGTAAEGHCFEVAGTPKPDADGGWSWWSTLFVGVFSLLHRLDPSLRYVHIWNECNAHFWQDKFPNGTRISGAWYAEFYRPVAQQLLQAFPGIMLGGPVTYSPPFVVDAKTGEVVTKTWDVWFAPLVRATTDAPQLLRWVDFHAYDGTDPLSAACPNCLNAEASTIELNLRQIGSASQALGRPGLLTALTETNFALQSAAAQEDWALRFDQRGVGLIAQTMALLRWPGLVVTRQLFDWGVPMGNSAGNNGYYRFLPRNPYVDPYTPEMEVYRAFSNFSGGQRLPGSGWTHSGNQSGGGDSGGVGQVQVEGVCVGEWRQQASHCSSSSSSSSSSSAAWGRDPCAPLCGHLKVALFNPAGSADADVVLRIIGMFCQSRHNTTPGPGAAYLLDSSTPGAQEMAPVACDNSSTAITLKAGALVLVECHCPG